MSLEAMKNDLFVFKIKIFLNIVILHILSKNTEAQDIC